VRAFADRHKLWFIEDCCDAVGAQINGRNAGTFGDLATVSFYPAHQMTMGEGGGVSINSPRLKKTARSLRDWGRDCWCDPGKSNTCGKRFCWELGDLPAPPDGWLLPFSLRSPSNGKLVVRTKSGYYAGNQSASVTR